MSSLKEWIIKKLGGYSSIDDAIEAIKANPLPQRTRILTLAVKNLYNTIGSEDILKVSPEGIWMLEGKPLRKEQVELLMAEATQFLGTTLWKVIQMDIRYLANKKMYILAGDTEQLTAGKLWVYTFDAIRTRLHAMKTGKAEFDPKI